MRRQSERIHEHSFNLEFSRIHLLKDFMHDAKLGSPSGPSEPVGQGGSIKKLFELGFYVDISWESRYNIEINV